MSFFFHSLPLLQTFSSCSPFPVLLHFSPLSSLHHFSNLLSFIPPSPPLLLLLLLTLYSVYPLFPFVSSSIILFAFLLFPHSLHASCCSIVLRLSLPSSSPHILTSCSPFHSHFPTFFPGLLHHFSTRHLILSFFYSSHFLIFCPSLFDSPRSSSPSLPPRGEHAGVVGLAELRRMERERERGEKKTKGWQG